LRATIEALGTEERGRYLTALTFGNVHGVYHPDSVHLRPEILEEIQTVVGGETGRVKPFDLVLHGGSGSSAKDVASAVASGVVKMNIEVGQASRERHSQGLWRPRRCWGSAGRAMR
jgi:fructose-bisphosphate aldolase, class II